MNKPTSAGKGASSPCKGEAGAKRRVGVAKARFDRTPAKTARARKLRREMTPAEARHWSELRAGQLRGLSFRRQHPIGVFVFDFYCPRSKIAIEVDGGQLGQPGRERSDRARTEWLAAKGVTILRFWNHDVMRNMPGVLDEISRTAESLASATPTRSASPTDLALAGGGGRGSIDIVFGEVDR